MCDTQKKRDVPQKECLGNGEHGHAFLLVHLAGKQQSTPPPKKNFTKTQKKETVFLTKIHTDYILLVELGNPHENRGFPWGRPFQVWGGRWQPILPNPTTTLGMEAKTKSFACPQKNETKKSKNPEKRAKNTEVTPPCRHPFAPCPGAPSGGPPSPQRWEPCAERTTLRTAA